jgi:beta-fructofuranosidase
VIGVGPFRHIYDPSVAAGEPWWLNDQCFVRDDAGTWHLFSITMRQPEQPLLALVWNDAKFSALPEGERAAKSAEYGQLLRRVAAGAPAPFDPKQERQLDHATAPALLGPWTRRPFALVADLDRFGERQLWAPHVVRHRGIYHMFYCAGGAQPTHFRIHLATSTDLFAWTRHPGNPLFEDGFEARDPMVLRVGDRWLMYYTATDVPDGGHHVVAYRESDDLVEWGPRRIAFTDRRSGTYGGPTESPFVLRRGDRYYLFLSMRHGYVPGRYADTDVFVSADPRRFEASDRVAHIPAHAAEVVRDVGGAYYVSHTGWWQGGTSLARLEFDDGQDDRASSL